MGGALQQLFQSGEEMMKMDPEQAAEMSELGATDGAEAARV